MSRLRYINKYVTAIEQANNQIQNIEDDGAVGVGSVSFGDV